jgi:hypothetical protein
MAFLEEIRQKALPEGPRAAVDNALDIINDLPTLHAARDRLTLMGKDKKIEIFIRARIMSMVGALNIFLDSETTYTWRQASLVSSKVQGHGETHAQRIQEWILAHVRDGNLPLHRLGQTQWSPLEDEDITPSGKNLAESSHQHVLCCQYRRYSET